MGRLNLSCESSLLLNSTKLRLTRLTGTQSEQDWSRSTEHAERSRSPSQGGDTGSNPLGLPVRAGASLQ